MVYKYDLPKLSYYNDGNVPFELQVQNNTFVSMLEVTSSTNTVNIDRVILRDILNYLIQSNLIRCIKCMMYLNKSSLDK